MSHGGAVVAWGYGLWVCLVVKYYYFFFSWWWHGFCGRCLVVFGGLLVCVCFPIGDSCWWVWWFFLMGLQVGMVVAWWLLANVWWVKWHVSRGFLMGFAGAWLPRGRGRDKKRKREKR